VSKTANKTERKAQRSVFGPACPYCGSKDAVIDPEVKSNVWREYVVYACMLWGGMTVTLYMRCNQCGGAFETWKTKTTPAGRGA